MTIFSVQCKSMAQDFKDAATELKGKAVLADVDATVEKELAQEYGIRGFPTLKLFSNGEVISDYKGARSKDAFVKYIERALLPSIEECDSDDAVTKFLKDSEGKSIFFGAKLDKLKAAFKKQSVSIRDLMPESVVFGSVEDVAHVKKALGDVEADSISVIRDDGTTETFKGEAGDLEAWIKSAALPLFAELNRDTASMYTELPKPIFILFQDPAKKDEKVNKDMEVLAKEFRGDSLPFVWVNSVELKSFMEHVGATSDPAIAIYGFEGDVKYVFDKEYSQDNLRAWLKEFVAGKIKATSKSAPIPEKNDEPVKVVVGDSWESIVQDKEKDVLIEQYAPWCGHCKKLEPILTELATELADIKTVVIAKMDATANDSPADYKAKGYPTIHFFPAGKTEGVEYNGDRTKAGFIKFLQENATHKDGLKDLKAEEPKDETKEETKEEAAEGEEAKEKEEL